MTDDKRYGRQTPTLPHILDYTETKGQEAIDIYNGTTREAFPWQQQLCYDILAINDDGLWVHTRFGYAVPRRNGKNEVIVMREMYGLRMGEMILHTAHRTSTSTAAYSRLFKLLEESGIKEIKGENRTGFKAGKSKGQEFIELSEEYGGGKIWFRTRSTTGGLGEGFSLLVIDEAQEYTPDQESALKYTVTDSDNPQTIYCGTPPTVHSSGTVFAQMRKDVLSGETINTGWAEWSVPHRTDVNDVDAWYECNPSLGWKLTERAIRDEIRKGEDEEIDFNIQRLGLWLKYNQQSAITLNDWEAVQCKVMPTIGNNIAIGIKFGHDGTNVALSLAVKTDDDRVFIEGIDCQSVQNGNGWIVDFLLKVKPCVIVIDGANGQTLLGDELKRAKFNGIIYPTVKEIIVANSLFEQSIFGQTICHMGQPSMVQIATNCEKRAIGSNGGFGFRSLHENVDIALLDSAILAQWACFNYREKKKQKINY